MAWWRRDRRRRRLDRVGPATIYLDRCGAYTAPTRTNADPAVCRAGPADSSGSPGNLSTARPPGEAP
jgi:hypothetical protein